MPALRHGGVTMAICTVFLAPALHPLLLPVVGVPSHLLWFAHVLPVAWITYHRGPPWGAASIGASLALLVAGERAFGAGYFVAVDWHTVVSLAVALGFINVLVAGFAAYARRARSLQEQLWQSQKMETLGLFAASVAHDFNNMLAAITLTSDMALEDLLPGQPGREYLTEIRDAADRAAMLCRRLLTFSRADAPRGRPLDIANVVRGLETLLRRLLPQRVELRVQTGAAPGIFSDAGHLEQIVMNLVLNASDAISEIGTVTLTVRTAHRGEVPDDEAAARQTFAVIEVSDTGTGMDAALQRRIFEPLFTTKPPGRGTGLGLSTVRELVTAWGGFVTVSSRVGSGSVFRVLLPAHSSADAGYGARVPGSREPGVRLAS